MLPLPGHSEPFQLGPSVALFCVVTPSVPLTPRVKPPCVVLRKLYANSHFSPPQFANLASAHHMGAAWEITGCRSLFTVVTTDSDAVGHIFSTFLLEGLNSFLLEGQSLVQFLNRCLSNWATLRTHSGKGSPAKMQAVGHHPEVGSVLRRKAWRLVTPTP